MKKTWRCPLPVRSLLRRVGNGRMKGITDHNPTIASMGRNLKMFEGFIGKRQEVIPKESSKNEICCCCFFIPSLLYSNETSLLFSRPPVSSSTGSLKRYYFEHLQLNSTQLKLSVSSSGRLPEDLQSLKSSLGLIIVNLEDATIDLGWWY